MQTAVGQLRSRWCDIPKAEHEQLNAVLADGDIYSDPRVGRVVNEQGEYLDLRGFNLIDVVRDKTLEQIDFSYMDARSGAFSRAELIDCIFYGVTGIGSVIDSVFTRCDFRNVMLRGRDVVGTFTDCSFEGANLQRIYACRSVFEGCSFDHLNLSGANLAECRFIRCSFEGVEMKGKPWGGSLVRAVFEDCDPLIDLARTENVGTKGMVIRDC